MGEVITSVDAEIIRAITQQVFGTAPRYCRFLGSGTGNLAYLIAFPDLTRYVVRFNRGFRPDVYDAEVENYRMVHAATGVRVPAVMAIDRSRRVVPTSYMIMEYLEGVEANRLWRDSGNTERRQIRAALGRFYAALHTKTRPADVGTQVSDLLSGLAQYAVAVENGFLDVDLSGITQCERVIRTRSSAPGASSLQSRPSRRRRSGSASARRP